MSGVPDLDVHVEKLYERVSDREKLALDHMNLRKVRNTIQKEHKTLVNMVEQDCDDTERMFAVIALQRAANRESERTGKIMSLKNIRAPKVGRDEARQLREVDHRVYSAAGRWNESGQFVPVRTEADKVGLVSAKYAQLKV